MNRKIITLTLNPSVDHIQTVKVFAPFEKNLVISAEKFLGGKGINAAYTLGKLGTECLALGLTSRDLNPEYTEKLNRVGVKSSFITVNGRTRENLKIVDLDTGKDTEFNQAGFEVDPLDLDYLDLNVQNHISDAGWLIMSGSLPPGTPTDYYQGMIMKAKSAGVRTCLDTSGAPLAEGVQAQPDLLRINLDELKELCSQPLEDEAQIFNSLVGLSKAGIKYLVISLGSRGVVGFDGKDLINVVVPRLAPVSLTGAGDSMTAAFIYQLNEGRSFQEALAFSAAVASASVLCKEPGGFRPEDAERIRVDIKIELIDQSM